MNAEQTLDKHCKFDSMGKFFKLRVIAAMEEYAKSKLKKAGDPKVKKFRHSQRAEQMMYLIYQLFDIKLKPEIHRRYTANETVKFEMRDEAGKVYFFEGLVKEFLEPSIDVSLRDKSTFHLYK